MTLDEAIKNMETIAEENQKVVDTGIVFDDVTIDMLYCDDTEVIQEHLANYQRCAEKHRQLAEWLKELKQLREYITTELEVCCAGTHDWFEAFDDNYYVLSKLNNMIAYNDRFPNNKKDK